MRTSLTCLALLLVAACGKEPTGGDAPAPTGPVRIHAVNHPLAAMAQRIGGDGVEVTFPVPRGMDPAFWRPTDAQVVGFQEAELILLNGAGYAKWVERATLPRRAVVDTSAAFASQHIETTGGVTHSHGPEGEHSHTGIAYTTWLDLDQAAQQADAILEAIVARRPALKDGAKTAHAGVRKALEALDARLKALGGTAPPMVGSHPVYQYLARRYGFDIESETWEPGAVPTDEQWAALEAHLAKRPAKVFLWEAPAPDVAVKRLEGLGLASVVFDPCANAPAQGDFLDAMRANVSRLEDALRP